MDYGKIAYMQIEDINRELQGVSGGGLNYIFFEDSAAKKADEYSSEIFRFQAGISAPLYADVCLYIKTENDISFDVRLYISGGLVDKKEVSALKGSGVVSLFFGADCIAKGENAAVLCASFPGSNNDITVEKTEIRFCGKKLSAPFAPKKLEIYEQGDNLFGVYSDGMRTYIDIDYQRTGLRRFDKINYTGDFTAAPCPTDLNGGYRTLFFYIDEGKLFLAPGTAYNSAFSNGLLIDENVRSASASRCFSPPGCFLYYLKENGVYCLRLFFNAVSGKITPAENLLVCSSQTAEAVTAVKNTDTGRAVILTEKGSRNTLYTNFTAQSEPPHSTVLMTAEVVVGNRE